MPFEKIYIELSDLCGLKCSFCPSIKAQRGIMSLENFAKIAPKLAQKAKIYTFHLLGDPLLLKNLNEYMHIAQVYKMKLELTTSGFYLNDKNKEWLLNFNTIHQINFSLMSFFEQNKIQFKAYIEPILELIKSHIQRQNQSFINLRLWNLSTKLKAPKENAIFYKILEENFKLKINTQALKTRLARKIILHQAQFFKWANLKNKTTQTRGSCYALSKQIAVLSNGKLVPCCMDTGGNIILGDLFEEELSAILNKTRAKSMKEGFNLGELREKLCQTCSFHQNKILQKTQL